MRQNKPVIGVTKPRERGINMPFITLWAAVWLGGGKPKVIHSRNEIEHQHFDGLMLGGGTDIFPGIFFKEPKENYPYDHERDELEIQLLHKAHKEGLPVFAICRGAQLMNIVNGGTLHLDVSKVYDKANYPQHVIGYMFFRKRIQIYEDTLLYAIAQRTSLKVNSIHRQSIDKVGEGLRVTSQEANGVIQSIEKPGHPFYLGVQFHPERMIYHRVFRRLFKFFIRQARQF